MGQRWLRGVLASNAGISDATNDYIRCAKDFNLFVFNFLVRILKYTLVETVYQTGSTWDWEAYSATGTSGALTNSDYTFVDSTASAFVAGHVGKFLVIVDDTNEKNCGIHEILTYVDPNTVTIDWYTTGGNFPISSTGITWYIIDGDDAGDPRVGDQYVVSVPHSTSPYTMLCYYGGYSVNPLYGGNQWGGNTLIQIAPEASAWDTGTHTWKTSVRSRLGIRKLFRDDQNGSHGRTYGYGHTDGSFWMIWDHHNNGTGNKQGAGACVLDPLETSPTPDPKELVHIWGTGPAANDTANWNRNFADGHQEMMYGFVWSESGALSEDCFWASWHRFGGSDIFRYTQGVNCRTGKRDALPIWVLKDPGNGSNHFAPWGQIPVNHMVLATIASLGDHVAFETDTYLTVHDDVVIPWPGWPHA